MAMSTYAQIATKVEQWLNREGFTSLTDQVEDLVAMAQRRIHRTCDFNAMVEVDNAFVIDAQTEATPADFLRARSLTIVQSSNVSYNVVGGSDQQVMNAGNTGRPLYYMVAGDSFYFGPTPDQSYTATLVYYKALPILSTSTASNWFSTDAPELILFGALLEASLFLKDDARAQVWEGRFNQVKTDIEDSEARMDKAAGDLHVRSM